MDRRAVRRSSNNGDRRIESADFLRAILRSDGISARRCRDLDFHAELGLDVVDSLRAGDAPLLGTFLCGPAVPRIALKSPKPVARVAKFAGALPCRKSIFLRARFFKRLVFNFRGAFHLRSRNNSNRSWPGVLRLYWPARLTLCGFALHSCHTGRLFGLLLSDACTGLFGLDARHVLIHGCTIIASAGAGRMRGEQCQRRKNQKQQNQTHNKPRQSGRDTVNP